MLCLVSQSYPTLCNPMDCSPPSSPPWGSSRQEYCSGLPRPPPGDPPNPGFKPRSSAFQADSLPFKPAGKPKNTGVFICGPISGFTLGTPESCVSTDINKWKDTPHSWIAIINVVKKSPPSKAVCRSNSVKFSPHQIPMVFFTK